MINELSIYDIVGEDGPLVRACREPKIEFIRAVKPTYHTRYDVWNDHERRKKERKLNDRQENN